MYVMQQPTIADNMMHNTHASATMHSQQIQMQPLQTISQQTHGVTTSVAGVSGVTGIAIQEQKQSEIPEIEGEVEDEVREGETTNDEQ